MLAMYYKALYIKEWEGVETWHILSFACDSSLNT